MLNRPAAGPRARLLVGTFVAATFLAAFAPPPASSRPAEPEAASPATRPAEPIQLASAGQTQPSTTATAQEPASAPATTTAAQTAPAEPAEEGPNGIDRLDWLIGEWEGSGWTMTGPGQREAFTIRESVTPRLEGQVLVVDGAGRTAPVEGQQQRQVHEAFGVLSYDADKDQFFFRAFRARDGQGSGQIDPQIEVRPDGSFDWAFEINAAGRTAITRYATRQLDDGRWQEKGYISLDGGKTWAQFFEMTLRRVDDSPQTPATAPEGPKTAETQPAAQE